MSKQLPPIALVLAVLPKEKWCSEIIIHYGRSSDQYVLDLRMMRRHFFKKIDPDFQRQCYLNKARLAEFSALGHDDLNMITLSDEVTQEFLDIRGEVFRELAEPYLEKSSLTINLGSSVYYTEGEIAEFRVFFETFRKVCTEDESEFGYFNIQADSSSKVVVEHYSIL
jgi:hypothetical protein